MSPARAHVGASTLLLACAGLTRRMYRARVTVRLCGTLLSGTVTACAGVQTTGNTAVAPASGSSATGDTTGLAWVAPGYGTLRQDDIAFHVTASGVLIRAVPLDEAVIRLLTPDSYKAMRDLQQSNHAAIDSVSRRYNDRPVSVWFVSFYGVEPDARFTPLDLMVSSSGRDFRPYDVIPLTTAFGEQRLHQRETQSALYLYDGDVELDQLVVVSYQGAQDNSWDQTLQRIERERAMIRARERQATTPAPVAPHAR